MCARTRLRSSVQAYARICVRSYVCFRIHLYAHTRTHARTRTHTRTSYPVSNKSVASTNGGEVVSRVANITGASVPSALCSGTGIFVPARSPSVRALPSDAVRACMRACGRIHSALQTGSTGGHHQTMRLRMHAPRHRHTAPPARSPQPGAPSAPQSIRPHGWGTRGSADAHSRAGGCRQRSAAVRALAARVHSTEREREREEERETLPDAPPPAIKRTHPLRGAGRMGSPPRPDDPLLPAGGREAAPHAAGSPRPAPPVAPAAGLPPGAASRAGCPRFSPRLRSSHRGTEFLQYKNSKNEPCRRIEILRHFSTLAPAD